MRTSSVLFSAFSTALLALTACGDSKLDERAGSALALNVSGADGDMLSGDYVGPEDRGAELRAALIADLGAVAADDAASPFVELALGGQDSFEQWSLPSDGMSADQLFQKLDVILNAHGYRLSQGSSNPGEAVSEDALRAGGADECGCVFCKRGVIESWCLYDSRCGANGGRVCAYTNCGNTCGTF